MTLRNLTPHEIKIILQYMEPHKGLPKKVADAVRCRIHSDIKHQLQDIKIHPESLKEFMQTIKKRVYKTMVAAGESVGLTMAQSLGEKQTQITLNTFHSAGLANLAVTSGVPRFTELLNATKNPKNRSMTVKLHRGNQTLESVRQSSRKFACTFLGEIIDQFEILETKIARKQSYYKIYHKIYGKEYQQADFAIRLQLDREELFNRNITLENISDAVKNSFDDVICVISPLKLAIIDIYVTSVDMDAKSKEHYRDMLSNIKIQGIDDIKQVFFEKDDNDKWIVSTNGSNFIEMAQEPNVNFYELVSNDMWQIYDALGIEAAREFLIHEYSRISGDNGDLSLRHTLLIVDIMTQSGTLTAISRYGMQRDFTGPLAKASFEESLHNFMMAGVNAEKESAKGCSSSLMIGKPISVGTGCIQLLFDNEKASESFPEAQNDLEDLLL